MAHSPPSRSVRRWGTLAAVVVAALLAIVLWPQSEATPTPGTERAAPAAAPGTAAVASRQQPPAPPNQTTPSAPQPPPPDLPPDSVFTTPAVPPAPPPVELPPSTQELAEEFFPGTTEWEEVPLDESQQLMLRVLPRHYNVVVPMPIVIFIEQVDRVGQRRALRNPHVRVRSLDDASQPWVDVPAVDDGSGEDAQRGDLRYTATLQPTAEQRRALLGRVLVEAGVDVPGTGTRVVPVTLIYTMGPRARLTGRWHDSLRDGHLWLEAELQVDEPGLFTLMAQVFGPGMEPIAWVRQTERLDAGRRTMVLQVFGKVLHDRGIDGPYRVRQVLLSRDHENSADYDPGVTIEEAHRTKPYRASGFSGEAYVPPPRTVEEITAADASQKEKPPPLKTRPEPR